MGHGGPFWQEAIVLVVAVFVVFEEWGWEPLSRLVGRLAKLRFWADMESGISGLSPRASLVVLAMPWVILVPIKLLALWLLATGQIAIAVLAIVSGKVAGTAVVARLFTLTKPSLMQMGWFARLYARWDRIKKRILDQARATHTWARVRLFKLRMQLLISQL